MTALLLAADDGIWSGKFNLADIAFLVAFILFIIAFVVRLVIKPIPLDMVLVAAGLACISLGLLVI